MSGTAYVGCAMALPLLCYDSGSDYGTSSGYEMALAVPSGCAMAMALSWGITSGGTSLLLALLFVLTF